MSIGKKIDTLISDIDELKELFDYFKDYDNEVPRIELDLALSRLREIYDALYHINGTPVALKKETQENTETKKEIKEEEKEPEETKTVQESATNENKPLKDEEEILADRFKGKDKVLGENIKGKDSNGVTEKMQAKPIDDLHKAFGVNDRFVFTKELFQGNRAKFKQTIDDLNNTKSYEEAISYIDDNFNWDKENEFVKKLIHLIKRKHNS